MSTQPDHLSNRGSAKDETPAVVKSEPESPNHPRPPMDENYDDEANVGDVASRADAEPHVPDPHLASATNDAQNYPSPSSSIYPDTSEDEAPRQSKPAASPPPEPSPEARPMPGAYPKSINKLEGNYEESPAGLPPETPADLIAPTPAGLIGPTPTPSTSTSFVSIAPSPFPPQSGFMLHQPLTTAPPVFNKPPTTGKVLSPAETLRADTSPDSDDSVSTPSHMDEPSPDSAQEEGIESVRFDRPHAQSSASGMGSSAGPNRRMTRGSLAAAAQAAYGTPSTSKRDPPEPGAPLQVSINCWIITNFKDWVLPPPRLGVSLAENLPRDVMLQDWMKLTRQPILWDGITDPGGKSGKKLVVIGTAAAKAASEGKLPAVDRDDTFDGLHLLMDFDVDQRPSYSYALMTRMAILGSPDKMLCLNDIYTMLQAKFPFFKEDESKWRDSIRYNLSSNNWFVKTKRMLHQPGIGGLWKVDEASAGGPKRPRKGRNKGTSAFTDAEDDGEEQSPDENPPIASAARNGTLMLTFDSKQKIPLDKHAAERAVSVNPTHNSIARINMRPSNAGASTSQVGGANMDLYAEAMESPFMRAALAKISGARETAERQKKAPRNTPAPPWMHSGVEHDENDSAIGSGKDENESDDDAGGLEELRTRKVPLHSERVVAMEEDSPSPPSPPSPSSIRVSANNAVAPASRKPANRRLIHGFSPTAGSPVAMPSIASLFGSSRGEPSTVASLSTASSPPPTYASSAVPDTTQTVSMVLRPQTPPAEPRTFRSDPTDVSRQQSLYAESRRPSFKPIAPSPTPANGASSRSAIASTVVNPYGSVKDRKRKTQQISPSRAAATEESRKKMKLNASGKPSINPLFKVGGPSPMAPPSSSAKAGGSGGLLFVPSGTLITSEGSRRAKEPVKGPIANLGASMTRSVSSSAIAPRPASALGTSTPATSTSSGFGQSGLPQKFPTKYEGTPFALKPLANGGINWTAFKIPDELQRPRRASLPSRERRTSGNMDVDDMPIRPPSPSGRQSGMELDDSDDEDEDATRGRRSEGGIFLLHPQGIRQVRGVRTGSALSVAVPMSSSRMERGPPTPIEGMNITPTSASQSPTVSNLVSPSGPLPPLNSLLGQRLPSGSRAQLPPIQSQPSRGRSESDSPHSPIPTTDIRRSSAPDLPACSNPDSEPSTLGPPLYYGFIVSDLPPIRHDAVSTSYSGGDEDDTAVPKYTAHDWRD